MYNYTIFFGQLPYTLHWLLLQTRGLCGLYFPQLQAWFSHCRYDFVKASLMSLISLALLPGFSQSYLTFL